MTTVEKIITFTGNSDRKVDATDVGVGAGAALGATKFGARHFKGFKEFGKVGDIVQISNETTKQIKQASQATGQIKKLWGRMFENAKQYTDSIVNWCKKSNTIKKLQPLFESKAFAKISGIIGGATAVFVFISGLGEMGETFTKVANKDA